MTNTAEADVRAFVDEFPTTNALRALSLCELGVLPWEKVADLFARSLANAVRTV